VRPLEALAETVEAMPAPVALLDTEWRILTHSPHWLEVFQTRSAEPRNPISLDQIGATGVAAPPEEALPPPTDRRLFFEVFADPDGAWKETFAQSLRARERRSGFERVLTQPDGPTYRMDWEVRPWQTPDGTHRGVLLAVTDRTQERHAKNLRRQVDHRFDKLVGTISEGVLLMDDCGVFRDGNEAAQNILGRSLDEIIGSRFDDDIWNGIREDGTPLPNVEFPYWRALIERTPVQNEVMGIYPPDAPPRWIRVNAQPLFRTGEDAPYAVLVSFDDITAERLKEEALQTSRDLLSSVLSSSLDGVMVFSALRDETNTIVDFECALVNPQAEKLIGSSAEDMVGVRLRNALPKQEEKGLFEAYREVVETGEPAEMEIRYDTDTLDAWFHVMAVKVENGVAVTYRDITERKEAERRIREQAHLLDKARDAILAHDMDGRIVYWNKSAERLTGWSKDEILGKWAHECLYDPDEDGKLQACHETMMAEGEWTGELRMQTKEGDDRIVESRWTLVRDGTGAPKHVLVINTDITERKQLESQMLRSQRMESIGRLVGGIAHDLGNLLVPITLGVKVLRRRVEEDDAKVDRTLSMIQKSAERGSDMVEQVLAFARGVEGERVALRPEPIIEEVEEMTEETFPEDIEVQTHTASDVRPIVGDATQIQQVLMNLCVNAPSTPATPCPTAAPCPSRRARCTSAKAMRAATSRRSRARTCESRCRIPARACPTMSSTKSLSRFSLPRRRARARAWGCRRPTASSRATMASWMWRARRAWALRSGCTCRWRRRRWRRARTKTAPPRRSGRRTRAMGGASWWWTTKSLCWSRPSKRWRRWAMRWSRRSMLPRASGALRRRRMPSMGS
jgi:PAS domain S-box-containing protein